jgi:hypothetical protein
MNTTAGRKSEIQKGENAAGIRPATIFDGNTAPIVTKKNPKLGTRSGLFAVCCLT